MSQIEDTISLSDSDETTSTSSDESDASLDSAGKLEAARRWQREQRERDEEEDDHAAATVAAARNNDSAKVPVMEEKRPHEHIEKMRQSSEEVGRRDAPVGRTAATAIGVQQSKPHQEAPRKEEGVQNAPTHHIAGNAPVLQHSNLPPDHPYASSSSSHSPPPPPTTKYAFNPSQKLGPDNGSMDAFIDTAFDEGLPPPPAIIEDRVGGKAPVAVMYDTNESSAVKKGTRVTESSFVPKSVRSTSPSIFGGKKAAGDVLKKQSGGDPVQDPRLGRGRDGGRPDPPKVEQVRVSSGDVERVMERETAPKIGFAALADKKKEAASAEGEQREGNWQKSCSAAASDKGNNNNAPGRSSPSVKGSSKSSLKKAPFPGITLSTKAPSRKISAERKRRKNDVLAYQTTVLNGNKKRTLAQIPVGELFNPNQIISEAQLERKRQKRRVSESKRRARKVGAFTEETRFDAGQTVQKAEPGRREWQQSSSESGQRAPKLESGGDRGAASIDIQWEQGLKNPYGLSHVNLVEDDDDVPVTIEEVAREKDSSTNSNIGGSPTPSHASLFLEDAVTEVTSVEEQGETDKDTDKQKEALAAASADIEPTFLSEPSAQRPVETVQQATVSDNDSNTPAPRPTIARKRISPDLLAALSAAPAINRVPDLESENEDEDERNSPEAPTTTRKNLNKPRLNSYTEGEILYEYHVIRSDFGPNIPEDNAVTTLFGPYHTLEEANESAKVEAGRSYEEMHAVERRNGRKYLGKGEGVGCEIGMVVDAEGCHTWRCVEGEGRGVVARVEKGVAPRDSRGASVPDSAFRIPRILWVALQFFRAASVAPPEPDDRQSEADQEAEEGNFVTLGGFTTPDLANKRAGQAVLSLRNRRLGNRGHDLITRSEHNLEMRRALKKLDEDEELFDQEVVTVDGGVGRVWVLRVEIEGPRN